MLIVLLDEPGLFVFQTTSDAELEIEPIDAESEIRAAYDENAIPFTVEWIQPNQRSNIVFGLIESIEHGKYRFVPDGPADPSALIQLIESHPDYTNPPEAKSDLDAILSRLQQVR